ncbi:MAG: hypothetical protein WCK89_08485 [bacterium]
MKKPVKRLLFSVALLGVVMAWPAVAQERAYTPFMLSFVTPLQVPFRDFDVGGLRVSAIYGECRDFDGLDLGFVGRATGHANGLQSCAVNIVDGDGLGLQANWIVGFVKGEYKGFQVGGVNYAAKMQGCQIGLLYNGAEHIEGCQIGLINITRTMIGVQIGLINVIQDNDVPFLPIINCYF